MALADVRRRTAELLEANRPDDPAGWWIDGFLILLIVANVVVAIIATHPTVRAHWGERIYHFEIFSVAVFTLEYLLRLWSCPDKQRYAGMSATKARLKWVFSPLGLIDLLAILPFYALFFYPPNTHTALLLRVFRGLRLLRIFKLVRYSSALTVFRNVLREEAGPIMVIAFVLSVALVMAA